ncbi:flagellar protein FlgN [Cytobacillus spongiae]|uniref:flagellar protein FlgN n=1 Tax=Cytobacillus spongiae TaxID=2901381 RepID=UPI001F391C1C|nr:flagellar protein FlgN [Cytobacillus spongiae]UII55617.1 flagellar protein FlgN [Cytobacillus spongiae]
MSIKDVISNLEKLTMLQKSLVNISMQKTEIIKSEDVEPLNQLIKNESKHIQVIKKIEADLIAISKEVNGMEEDSPTITDLIHLAEGDEQERLLALKQELEETIGALTKRNRLNQQLLEQSLQFIQVSMDLLNPTIDSYNYEKPNQSSEYEELNRSIFNSKA